MGKIDLVKAMTELDEETVLAGVKGELAAGVPAMDILNQLQQGMEGVGKLYEAGDYFLSELIMSADVFTTAADQLSVALTADSCEAKTVGTVVLGTVKEDIHDIGKNIVATILRCNGFKVVDLGVDVPVSEFISAVSTHKPAVVGMCCLLTTAFDSMRETVAAVRAADAKAVILVGGGPVDDNVGRYVGADGVCKSAYGAVESCRKLVEVK